MRRLALKLSILVVALSCGSTTLSSAQTEPMTVDTEAITTGVFREHVLPLQTPLPYTTADGRGQRATIVSNVFFTLYQAATTSGKNFHLFKSQMSTYLVTHGGGETIIFVLRGKNGEDLGQVHMGVERDVCNKYLTYHRDDWLRGAPNDLFERVVGVSIHSSGQSHPIKGPC